MFYNNLTNIIDHEKQFLLYLSQLLFCNIMYLILNIEMDNFKTI